MQHKLLINGELVSGEGEKQPVYNPATGDVFFFGSELGLLLYKNAESGRQMQHLPNGGKPRQKRVRNAC